MSDFIIKQNDTRPYLDAQLANTDGTPIDLTGCTVRFFMVSTSGGQPKINAQCAITDAVNGKVRYYWQAGDTESFGDYKAEFEITFPDGSKQTVPNDGYLIISVVREIA
jgi:Rib/alpha/Esp surface antigen-like repeat protein